MNTEEQTIGNKYGDCIIACYNCGVTDHLFQVAHRDEKDMVCGYLFLCNKCHSHLIGKGVSLIDEAELRAECQARVERIFKEFENLLRKPTKPRDWVHIFETGWKSLKQREGIE